MQFNFSPIKFCPFVARPLGRCEKNRKHDDDEGEEGGRMSAKIKFTDYLCAVCMHVRSLYIHFACVIENKPIKRAYQKKLERICSRIK